ncbi:Uncharacterised protein [Mycobacterium tuberculosis]|nr:Uncharacterised protein [Mycobacterium tuberculosis]
MRSHRAYSGPAKIVRATVTVTIPAVATVMIFGMCRRSCCSSAAGAPVRYEMRPSVSVESSSSRQNARFQARMSA